MDLCSKNRRERLHWPLAAAAVLMLAAAPAYTQTTTNHTTEENAPFDFPNSCNGDNVSGEGTRRTNSKITTKNGTPTHFVTNTSHNGRALGTPSLLKYSFGEKTLDNIKTTAPFVVSRHRIRLVSETNADNFFATEATTVHKDGRTQSKIEPEQCRG